MNDESAPKGALTIAAPQRDQVQGQPNPKVEVEARIEAAAGLLTAAMFGRIDHALAEWGAVRLIDKALVQLEVESFERELVGVSR